MPNILFATKHSTPIWVKVTNVILEKEVGNFFSEKLGIILIYETDFKFNKNWFY